MAKKYVIGNWKMNLSFAESNNLISDIYNKINILGQNSNILDEVVVAVAPASTHLGLAAQTIANLSHSNIIKLAAQDCGFATQGAYTGDNSLTTLRDELNVSYCIIGHSERRTYHNENDSMVNRKALAAIAEGLVPIICVGETELQKQNGETFSLLMEQILTATEGFNEIDSNNFLIAYEPVWAIGTGKVATTEEIQKAHEYIKNILAQKLGRTVDNYAVIYGGSVNENNCQDIIKSCPAVSGFLVGGASLNSDKFTNIIKSCINI